MDTEDRRTAAFSKSDELVFVGGHGFPVLMVDIVMLLTGSA
jgi:hypothetical protein